MKCAQPGCERAAAVSTNPAVIFANCWAHTGALLAQAFGASDSPVRAGSGSGSAPGAGLSPGPHKAAERSPVSAAASD